MSTIRNAHFRILIYIFFLSSCCTLHAQSKIQRTVNEYIEKNGFSGTILVAEAGKILFHQSYGLAYIPAKDSLQNSYHYHIASITKLFTSIRCLQLMEGGNIDLKRSVVEYLPEFEGILDPRITPHHLLLHISGLPYIKRKIYQQLVAPTAIVKKSLNNKSKAAFNSFNYNDLDYVILGLLIEKCTEHSWEEEIQKHILDALNMESTGFLQYGYYPEDFAYCYRYKRGRKAIQDPFYYIENLYAAGNMYSTSTDLLKLDQALYGDQLLSPSSKALLKKSNPTLGYVGYGVWNYSYPFVESQPRIMERRGGILGANVVLVRIISSNQTIVILSNDNRFNPDSFGDEDNLREALIRVLSSD